MTLILLAGAHPAHSSPLDAMWRFLGFGTKTAAPVPPSPPEPPFVKGQLIVSLKNPDQPFLELVQKHPEWNKFGCSKEVPFLDSVGKKFHDQEIRKRLRSIRLIHLDPGADLSEVRNTLLQSGAVLYAHPNWTFQPDLTPNDPLFADQYALELTEAAAGWDFEQGSEQTVVCVIDGNGVDWQHQDLISQIWTNPGELPGNGVDDDQNGFTDDIRGWDFADGDNDPTPPPDGLHGTEVAGVIAALPNNELGVAGAMWQVSLMPIRVSYDTVSVTQALYYAIGSGADVCNMSFGSYFDQENKYGPNTTVEEAIETGTSSVLFVSTAGNDGVNRLRYPGAYETVIGVAATGPQDQWASFSNYGPWVDVAAPGVAIKTTAPGNDYRSVNGTSFAAPLVAGLAGLIRSQNPDLSLQAIKDRILYTVDTLHPLRDIGTGRINFRKALDPNVATRPFAVIRSPTSSMEFSPEETVEVRGTALGSHYQLLVGPESDPEGWVLVFEADGEVTNGVLGSFALNAFNPGAYLLELHVTEGSQTAHHVVPFRIAHFLPGWPVSITPRIASAGDLKISPNFEDLDGDGRKEVVIAVAHKVYLFSSAGEVLPGWPVAFETHVFTEPAIGDVDGDGTFEVVISTGADLSILETDGSQQAHWVITTPSTRNFGLALSDWDHNGDLEIVSIESTIAEPRGYRVRIYHHDGSLLTTLYEAAGSGHHPYGAPVVADFNNDGEIDVGLFTEKQTNDDPQMTSRIILHDGTSPFESTQQWYIDNFSPLAASIEGEMRFLHPYSNQWIHAWSLPEQNMFEWYLDPYGNFQGGGAVVAGNTDGEPDRELIIATNRSVLVLKKGPTTTGAPPPQFGSLRPGWPQDTLGKVLGSPLVIDLTGDGMGDIIAATDEGVIHCWSADGTPLPGCPHRARAPLFNTPIVTDLDGNGTADLLAVDNQWTLYAWDLEVPYDQNRVTWDRFGGDPYNRRRLEAPPPPNTPPVITPIPPLVARQRQKVTIQVIASDPDGIAQYELVQPGVSTILLNPATGQMTLWFMDPGTYTNGVRVCDTQGACAEAPFTMEVQPNQPPTIDPIPTLTVQVLKKIQLRVRAQDPEGTALKYAVTDMNKRPIPNLTIGKSTGLLTFAPRPQQVGTHEVKAWACDAESFCSSTQFRIVVLPFPGMPGPP